MMAGIDHAAIDLDDVDPTSDWFISKKAPLFRTKELENLEGQATEDMGESVS